MRVEVRNRRQQWTEQTAPAPEVLKALLTDGRRRAAVEQNVVLDEYACARS
jgi:hypothetical protein